MSARSTVVLRHVNVDLALHQLRAGEGRALLLLHGLGERTPDEVPRHLAAWPGPVWGLDLTGHGASTSSAGGGYTAEVLMADADHALAHLGEATVLGRGLGAYVALLIAGARPRSVVGAILTDGPGLAGGGPSPHSPSALRPVRSSDGDAPTTPDPYALAELSQDVRPADYATAFVRQAQQFSGLETPIAVAGVVRPPWLSAVADEHGVASVTLPEALRLFADATPTPAP
ncbi:lysophospholipase [Aquihabitans sp. G128]|uniref:alpha/beta fold hydrolase n=1 Tax=Aquihabitans sp. G128 TaxID=2849779 RepID=UPI001C235539|nr:alpha/beta fold hydrolase [Aquihabitans sp. G128]QXC59556.1 lysophospholipase [Aquihabitans sp. G128]